MLQLKTSPIHIFPLEKGKEQGEQGSFFFFFQQEILQLSPALLLASQEMPEIEHVWLTEGGNHEINSAKRSSQWLSLQKPMALCDLTPISPLLLPSLHDLSSHF